MLACVYRRDEGGLVLAHLPEPIPGPGQVLVAVRFAGICGSDLFLVRSGRLPDGTVLGHEMSGVVDLLGPGVSGIRVGQGVIVRPMGCGRCAACARGEENLCAKRVAIGLAGQPGAFAQRLVVPTAMVIPMPEGLGFLEAALAEPLATALHAVRLGEIGPKDRVLVLGGGGVGLACVGVLRALGIEDVLLSEPVREKRERALALGARAALDPSQVDLEPAMHSWTGGEGPSAVLECAGRVETVEQALRLVAVGGRVVVVGLAVGTLEISPALVMLKQIRLQGSFANTQAECRECLALLAQGRVRVEAMVQERIPLEKLLATFRALMERPSGGKVMVEMVEEER